MKQMITDLTGINNFIINSNDLEVELKIEYILYSVLDALVNLVSAEDLKKYFKLNKQYITLYELTEIYKLRNWEQNSGIYGIFFERFVYNIIAMRNYNPLNSFILGCLNNLELYNKGDDFDFILWGTEKGKWLADDTLNFTLNVIREDDYIYIGNQCCKFRDILKRLYHVNKDYHGLEKADLFVKLKNSKQWFGVDVKLNIEDFQQSNKNILPIRVALKTNKILRLQNLDKIDNFTFIFPKENDYGELTMRYFRYIFILFKQILKNNKYNLIPELYEFNTNVTFFFLENKNKSIFKILDSFARDIKSKGIPLPERIIMPNTCNTLLINNMDYSLLDFSQEETIEI
ncbi:hypothetical protein ACO1GV_05770 [Fusobacterium watanabei]|uniref:hypothetical protein n=1 Tax=Fusobacterium watanabei TaxID=2686067 RepID=UPI003B5883B4